MSLISLHFDTVIIGGGLAGLSLANHLIQGSQKNVNPHPLNVLIVEPRRAYNNDRTWCFWHDETDPLASHQWSSWQFSQQNKQTLCGSINFRYQCVQAKDFYHHALQGLTKNQGIHLINNTLVEHVFPHKDGVILATDSGIIQANHIIDTRPPKATNPHLFQTFIGIEIEALEPVFDPTNIELMTDMQCDKNGFGFSYILPFSEHRALIEPTRFHRPGMPMEVLHVDLLRLLKRCTNNGPYQVIRTEKGTLPMGYSPNPTLHDRWVLAGASGGAIRPSTGYAYLRIQRWAKTCAKELLAGRPPNGHSTDPWIYRRMDQLFLQLIRNNPDLAPNLFMNLATNTHPDALVRFLSDMATTSDFYQVVSALPASPFLTQILRQLTGDRARFKLSAKTVS
jgi:lycopene beta-cyclase